jgi:hypothetical protein
MDVAMFGNKAEENDYESDKTGSDGDVALL